MRRLLLPLITALALPTAANADYYLALNAYAQPDQGSDRRVAH